MTGIKSKSGIVAKDGRKSNSINLNVKRDLTVALIHSTALFSWEGL